MAYEIMQTLRPNSARWFHSLDDIYYFGGQGGHEETAIYRHSPQTRGEQTRLLFSNLNLGFYLLKFKSSLLPPCLSLGPYLPI